MPKPEAKTKESSASVDGFLDKVPDNQQREDSREIVKLMQRLSGDKPKMWGPSIIGFGSTKLKYDSGRELDWMKIGFSPRKGNIVLYGMAAEANAAKELGKFKTGKGCLYIKRLSDVDLAILEKMIKASLWKKS